MRSDDEEITLSVRDHITAATRYSKDHVVLAFENVLSRK